MYDAYYRQTRHEEPSGAQVAKAKTPVTQTVTKAPAKKSAQIAQGTVANH
jgi:hypothetical protein